MTFDKACEILKEFFSESKFAREYALNKLEMKPEIHSELFKDNLPKLSREKGGVYFILDEIGKIYYIGKSDKTRLHHEIWSKINTPVGDDKKRVFPKHIFKNFEGAEFMTEGRFKVATIEFDDSEYSSLAEVLLQTILKDSQEWPAFNKRIG